MKQNLEGIIPKHLKQFVVEQNYEKYTPRDHALWRFILRNAKEFLSENAHESFLKGLELTGIPTERIPRVSEMDEKLSQFGWRAICVCGFIPPLAFLEFQSNKILPIAADMRSVEHFDYTPAPDIVHEALGHAPILADEHYRHYLSQYAVVARRAIFSAEDVRLYEAIRFLSDVKENPDADLATIERAEEELKKTQALLTSASEATQLMRMYWWTVEYGLVGSLENPKVYGAGLLSSLGEARDCLEDGVKKIPFGLSCTSTSYDITEPQPQLFVTKDFLQLSAVLSDFEKNLSYRKGGHFGLEKAREARTVTTAELSSGLQVSGLLEEFENTGEECSYLKWGGPVQLCEKGKQLSGHGSERHGEGFSCPLGSWQGFSGDPSNMSDKDLLEKGMQEGETCEILFSSGFVLKGVLKGSLRSKEGKLMLLTFSNCTVSKESKIYFDPSWGEFDLAVGSSQISSVGGGPADWENYEAGNFGQASTQPGRTSPYTEKEKELFAMYAKVRDLREFGVKTQGEDKVFEDLEALARSVLSMFSEEWLLAIEISELMYHLDSDPEQREWFSSLRESVLNLEKYAKNQSRFMKLGIDSARKQIPLVS